MGYLRTKKLAILEIFNKTKTNYLEGSTLLTELEKRGFKMNKRQLSLFIYNNMEMQYLKTSRSRDGTIVGWKLIGWI